MVAAMDKVGVDGAIFISAFSMYRYDGCYAVEVQQAYPGRFAIIKPVDPDDPAVTDVIADWKKTPGAVPGSRILSWIFGTPCPRVRRLGFRSLLVGHGLDARLATWPTLSLEWKTRVRIPRARPLADPKENLAGGVSGDAPQVWSLSTELGKPGDQERRWPGF
jgi:L-fuconolactonase